MKLPCQRHGSAVHSLPSIFTMGGGGGGGGSDGEEGCFAVAKGGRGEGPGGRICHGRRGAGLLFGGGSFFVGGSKGTATAPTVPGVGWLAR